MSKRLDQFFYEDRTTRLSFYFASAATAAVGGYVAESFGAGFSTSMAISFAVGLGAYLGLLRWYSGGHVSHSVESHKRFEFPAPARLAFLGVSVVVATVFFVSRVSPVVKAAIITRSLQQIVDSPLRPGDADRAIRVIAQAKAAHVQLDPLLVGKVVAKVAQSEEKSLPEDAASANASPATSVESPNSPSEEWRAIIADANRKLAGSNVFVNRGIKIYTNVSFIQPIEDLGNPQIGGGILNAKFASMVFSYEGGPANVRNMSMRNCIIIVSDKPNVRVFIATVVAANAENFSFTMP